MRQKPRWDDVGARLEEVRRRLKITQKDVNDALGKKSLGYASRLLRSEREPLVGVVMHACAALNIDPRWLLLGQGPMFLGSSSAEDVYPERAAAVACARLDGIRPDAIEIIATLKRSTAAGVPPLTWRQWLSRIEAVEENLDAGLDAFGDALPEPPRAQLHDKIHAVKGRQRL